MGNGLLILFLAFIQVVGTAAYGAASPKACSELLGGVFTPSVETRTQTPRLTVTDLNTFGQAMSEGMLLRPEQGDLFEIYRKIFFGDPNTSVNNETLKSVTDILKKNPELQKPHFREYEIQTVIRHYEIPESLAKYLKSQTSTSGQVRSSLFQIEANLGYWKKMIGYADPDAPSGLTRDQQKEFSAQAKARFMRYLDRIVSKENRELLKNEKTEYKAKVLALYNLLKRMYEHMDRRGRDTRLIRQAMVALIATAGFSNQATQSLLKGKNALDKVEGLKKILDERDAFAMELGFKDHFKSLMESLKIDFPTGSTKGENIPEIIVGLERDVLRGRFSTTPSDVTRVRSLSIQEAPFRSCLGGSDCSTRTYFSKALDPNYNYFTMTDSGGQSSGHATVVLGTAKNQQNQSVPVAFLDKFQNVPNRVIPNFLEAVRLSLAEQGYLLGIPEDVGDHNGLSNMDTTRHFVAGEVLPALTEKLTGFTPYPNQYRFKNSYSRAENKLSVRAYQLLSQDAETQITPGRSYEPYLADADLNKNKLVQDLINLRESNQEQDVLRYISSDQVIESLEKLGLFSMRQFTQDLGRIINNSTQSLQVRKQSLFQLLLITNTDGGLPDFKIADAFSEAERQQLTAEIRQWSRSSDKRKKRFSDGIANKWIEAAANGDINTLEGISGLNLIDVNQRNVSGHSTLVMALNTGQNKVVEWLARNPKVDLTAKDNRGYTDLENARLLGKTEIANLISRLRPETSGQRQFNVKERNADGSPIIAFVKIPSGKFMMGKGDKKVLVELTKPFELMSVDTTQDVWEKIAKLAKNKFPGIVASDPIYANGINPTPSRFKGKNLPVEQVSFNDIGTWLNFLNKLSGMDDPKIQETLKELFPGHVKGHKYALPTEYQWEYVARNLGIAEGLGYSHGNSEQSLKEEAWYSGNSSSKTNPVGQKKPTMILGQPVYDIRGNVWKWMDTWYGDTASGGVDPQGPATGSDRVMRGGSWNDNAQNLRSAFRGSVGPGHRDFSVGFRLVRTAK